MKIVNYKASNTKEEFIKDFCEAPRNIRDTKYHIGLLPDMLWALFFKLPIGENDNYFLCYDDKNQCIGRIGITHNMNYPNTAFVGFFESKSSECSKLLVEAVKTIAKKSKDKNMIGPLNMNTWFQYRFARKHEDNHLFNWEPINPPSYLEDFKTLGFEVTQSFTSQGIDSVDYKLETLKKAHDKATSFEYEIKHIDFEDNFDHTIKDLYDISIDGFSDNLFYSPITFDMFKQLYVPAFKQYDFKYSTIAYSKEKEPVAVTFAFNDNGYLVLKTIAVKKKHRQKGISNALVYITTLAAIEDGLNKTVTALVKDSAVSEVYGQGGDILWEHKYFLFEMKL